MVSSSYLSKLDLTKGFYQIPLDSINRSKTAFCIPWGKFQFSKMPFRLRNAPTTFQRIMHVVLDGLEEHSGSYIGDILIHSSSWEEHLKHVREALQRLKDNGLMAKPKKCQ